MRFLQATRRLGPDSVVWHLAVKRVRGFESPWLHDVRAVQEAQVENRLGPLELPRSLRTQPQLLRPTSAADVAVRDACEESSQEAVR